MNIYEIAEPSKNSETFFIVHQTPTLKIEAIRSRLFTPGDVYDQEEDEWVLLVRGEARLQIQNDEFLLRAGNSLFLPRHTLHRVLSTSDDALWIAVFSS